MPTWQKNGKSFASLGTITRFATELNKKHVKVQVASLLTIIGEKARDVYSTFTDWESEESKQKGTPLLDKFTAYCQPRRNILFECYIALTSGRKNPGLSYDQYKTELRKLATTTQRVPANTGEDRRSMPSVRKHSIANEGSERR